MTQIICNGYNFFTLAIYWQQLAIFPNLFSRQTQKKNPIHTPPVGIKHYANAVIQEAIGYFLLNN